MGIYLMGLIFNGTTINEGSVLDAVNSIVPGPKSGKSIITPVKTGSSSDEVTRSMLNRKYQSHVFLGGKVLPGTLGDYFVDQAEQVSSLQADRKGILKVPFKVIKEELESLASWIEGANMPRAFTEYVTSREKEDVERRISDLKFKAKKLKEDVKYYENKNSVLGSEGSRESLEELARLYISRYQYTQKLKEVLGILKSGYLEPSTTGTEISSGKYHRVWPIDLSE